MGNINIKQLIAISLASVVAGVASTPVLAAGDDLQLQDAYMRVITTARPAAGYFTLKNTGTATRVLIGASSPVCGKAMLHQSKMVDGVMKMLPVKELAVAPGDSLTFAPGGYHVMCMKPAKDIKTKALVPVTLKFKNGESLTGDFVVKGAK